MEPLQPHQSRWYRRTDPQGRALLALLLPLAGVYLCQLVTLQEPAAAWAWMGSHAGAAGYTYLVLLLAQLLVATLTDSLLCGQLLTLLPCLLLSVASHLKQARNGVPLLVSDLAMAGQAGQIRLGLRRWFKKEHNMILPDSQKLRSVILPGTCGPHHTQGGAERPDPVGPSIPHPKPPARRRSLCVRQPSAPALF